MPQATARRRRFEDPRQMPTSVPALKQMIEGLMNKIIRRWNHLRREPHDYRARQKFERMLNERAQAFAHLMDLDPAAAFQLAGDLGCSGANTVQKIVLESGTPILTVRRPKPFVVREPTSPVQSIVQELALQDEDGDEDTQDIHFATDGGDEAWYRRDIGPGGQETGYVVVEYMLGAKARRRDSGGRKRRKARKRHRDNGHTVGSLKAGETIRAKWQRDLLDRITVITSMAVQELAQTVQAQLHVVVQNEAGEDHQVAWPFSKGSDRWFVKEALLRFPVNEQRAERARRLLDQPMKTSGFTNGYRLVSCTSEADASGLYWVTASLACGQNCGKVEADDGTIFHYIDHHIVVQQKVDGRKKVVELTPALRAQAEALRSQTKIKRRFSKADATMCLQQLFVSFMKPYRLASLPKALQPGACQEFAQQLMSALANLEARKVRGDVNFPTVEDRNPETRMQAYLDALEALVTDLAPLSYCRARDKDPGKYKADDPRGDRLIVDDSRWENVRRSPEPHPIPLLFVESGMVRIQHGQAAFDAGLSKADRHAGRTTPREEIRKSRPAGVQRKGVTHARPHFARLPLLDATDEVVQQILAERDERKARAAQRGQKSRGLDFGLVNVPLWPDKVTDKARDSDMLLPISFDRKRLGRILHRNDFKLCWTRVVRKTLESGRQEWFLQLTLGVPYQNPTKPRPILGVTFGVDALLTWALMDTSGNIIQRGQHAANPQIAEFLHRKKALEWDQVRGRWVGGKRFAPRLKDIAHQVSNQIVKLAREHDAVLAVHDISWVSKSGADSAANVRFTAWAYGQLRRYLEYKAPLAGLGEPVFASDFLVRMTCPSCGACYSKSDPKGEPTTWREKDVLNCRSCGWQRALTHGQEVERVLAIGQPFWQGRWDKAAGKKK